MTPTANASSPTTPASNGGGHLVRERTDAANTNLYQGIFFGRPETVRREPTAILGWFPMAFAGEVRILEDDVA